ncbi:MAG: stage III sporulation protein AE [Oscillospiraceae bacterium]|jgi:stage III sporulation protein AE|nr:stage III sporulation protein AE [Oscillospiraceae bacterium]
MKRKYAVIICFLIIILPSGYLAADPSDGIDEVIKGQFSAIPLEELQGQLPADARNILDDIEIKGISLDDGLGKLINGSGGEVKGALASSLRSASVILIIMMLCGLAQSFYDAGSDKISGYIPIVGALAIAACAVTDITSFIGMGREMMDSVNIFSKGLLATLAGVAGTIGKPVSSAAKYMAAIFFSDILITIINKLLLPILYAYIAVATANCALGEDILAKLGGFLKWICITVLSLLLTVFTAYITVSGIVSGSADAVTAKTAKLVVSNAVPIVGKIISDAAETVLAGAQVVKSSIGIFGLLGVLAICLGPFIRLGVQYIIFKAASAVGAPFCNGRLTKLTDDLAGAFGIMLGMVGASALVMIISTVSLMSLMSP